LKLIHFLPWQATNLDDLSTRFPDVDFVKAEDAAHAAQELVDADILVTGGPYYLGDVATAVNTHAPKLKWIQSLSIGTDIFEKGGVPSNVAFTNAAGLKGRTVAEHAMALMLAHMHAIPEMERFRQQREWGRPALRARIDSVEDHTLLLLGYGSIGQEIARKAKAFDMNVIALNRSGTGSGDADTVAPINTLSTWLSKADFVANSLPLVPGTEKLMGAVEFALMKPSAVLINVGRGPVVDQSALIDALRDNQIAGACLDVFDEEPLTEDDPIWDAPNVIISPHVGGTGGPIGPRFAELLANNLVKFLQGQPLENQVDINSV
jgi:D-2-hydroxyacid dehydrogenase (NADP+)